MLALLVAALVVAGVPLAAQTAPSGTGSSPDPADAERAAGLDPDLLAIVEQIVGLRISEQGLLADLSAEDRARVLDAVARLLAPPQSAADPDDAVSVEAVRSAETRSGTDEPPAGSGGSSSAGVEAEPAAPDTPSSPDADVPSVGASDRDVACEGWLVWDTNEDRVLSGADRYWRHFVIWIDDGDGVAEADEMEDTFELGLRKLDLDLRSYEGAKDSTGVVERREVDGLERLRVELLRGSAGYGVLAIDLDGMVRGQAPRLRLRSVDGASARDLQEGYVPIQEGLEIEQVFGSQTRWRPLLCDR